jgi:hypothetical protein
MGRGIIIQHSPGEVTWLEWALYKMGHPWRWLRGRKSY